MTTPADEPDPTHFISPDALDFLCAQFHAYYIQANQSQPRPSRPPNDPPLIPIAANPQTIDAWFSLTTKERNRLRTALALTLRHFNVYIQPPLGKRDYGAHNQ